MAQGTLLAVKKRSDEFSYIAETADAELADQLPRLRLPCMDEPARAAFRAVLAHEKPPANGSVISALNLAQARGFSVHPSDWLPSSDNDPYSHALYRPWVDWLSDEGFTPYHCGNTLTTGNWDKWKPKPRQQAIRDIVRENRALACDLALNWSTTQPTSVRLELLQEFRAGGTFYGAYPWQAPVLKHFLNDKSEKIRALAAKMLETTEGLETEEDHAALLAKRVVSSGASLGFASKEDADYRLMRHLHSTSFEKLASALSLSLRDLALRWTVEQLTGSFYVMIVLTADADSRAIVAARKLDASEGWNLTAGLFRDLPEPLRERGLRRSFRSEYTSSVEEFLGPDLGSLEPAQMHELIYYERMSASVVDEIKDRKLPVNVNYDPLRHLGLVLNKDAAKEAMQEAVSLGMKADHPRLTMLKFNLAM